MANELIDNTHKTLKADFIQEMQNGSKVAIAASCFSIYAFEELKAQFTNLEELRFIFTSPTFVTEKTDKQQREFYIPRLNRERNLYGSEFEIKLRNELSQKAIAKECAEWIKKKACFKSNYTGANMMGFAIVNDKAYTPITGFTTVELGCERGDNAYTMINKFEAPFSQQYLSLFNQIWNDSKQLQVVTDKVLDNISNVYKENAPEFIYFVTLYNIFREFLNDLSEDVLPNEATGFKSSVIWNKLYNFQRDAALAIINKLEKYNGCILADSVGLGKTFTALSVIKYYENRNRSVLVLCPKKLHQNWVTYRSNYINNPLVADRLRYDILYHTDLSRNTGQSNGLDLAHINWGNYDLVVIDESHNFRNGGKVTTDENDENPRENRYLQLMNKVIRSGVKTKVLMLSATPVNNRFNDLRNQLQLAYEGDAEQMDALLNTTSSIDKIFRDAQSAFNHWSKLPHEERTTKSLLSNLSFDFFEVLDSVTIARSRKHIEQYYDTTDIGKFPERLKPISRSPELTDLPTAVSFNDIFVRITKLDLAIYSPSDFILRSKAEKYAEKKGDGTHGGLSRKGRERGLRQLMSINLLKRLESSVNSFRLTLTRIKNLHEETIAQIDAFDKNRSVASQVEEPGIHYGFDDDELDALAMVGGNKTLIELADMDYVQWRGYLVKDLERLRELLFMLGAITPEHDSKLQLLIEDIRGKFANPINPGNKKILIFTAFSDTALYLYNHIAERVKERTGMNTALVTGDVEARCTLKTHEKMDFNKVLTLFSPVSKEKDAIYPHLHEEIDVLIATDCISEGQNLQDCDYLINYDIHWNPVRIIQRFGRIDRIGSRNAVIQLVNYWPNVTLDEYIDLKGRVEARMKVSVLTSTGDDNPLSPEEKGDLEYRREQLKRLQNEVVDLEEMNTGISIMDLGLNEFRLDLLAYMQENPDIEHTPNGMNAVIAASDALPAGVIFVLRNRRNEVNIGNTNQLHPFYMVYVSMDGEVLIDHLESKKMLDTLRLACKGNPDPFLNLCGRVNRETKDGRDMSAYTDLLRCAIESIVTVKEESDMDSLFSEGETSFLRNEIAGLDDFELITFLIVK